MGERVTGQRIIVLACALLATLQPAQADFGDYLEHTLSADALTITTSAGTVRLTLINPTALYAHYVAPGVSQLPSFALSGEQVPATATLSETDTALTFGSERLTVHIQKSDLTLSYFLDGQPLIAEEFGYFAHPTRRGFRFRLADGEVMFGGGERVLGMDRRGHSLPLYNRAHYGYTGESNQMYYGLPAVMSSRRYAIVFDNTATGRLDIGHDESDVLLFEARAGRTAYLVSAERDFPALVSSLTQALGRQPLLPRWAHGNFASRFGYRDAAQVRDVVARFQAEDMPLDAVVLDLYWFGPDIQGHVGNLAWDRNSFPDPEGLITELADAGIKTIPITEPFVLTTSRRWSEAVAAGAIAENLAGAPRLFDFYFGNTGLIDVFDDEGRDWLWARYAELFAQGVAGVWGDLGEPEVHPDNTLHTLSDTDQQATGDEVHNAFGHEWARLVFEGHARDHPQERPFIMMRAGFAGTQRYGIVPWTGDVDRSWGGLAAQVELSLQMGLFGLGYIHSDLGGFAGGEAFDRSLYLRWLQMGTFQPVFRPHAQEHIPAEPVFHDALTRRIARKFIRLRYRLLPYIETLAFENARSGTPLVRPVFFLPEADDTWLTHTDSYLFGDSFLVHPIVTPDEGPVAMRLPPGVWFDYWTDARATGPEYRRSYALDELPVLVRAGAFVPEVAAVATTRDYTSAQMTLHYYDDVTVRHATGRHYEDDGRSRQSLTQGAYDLARFEARRTASRLHVRGTREGSGYPGMPDARDIDFVVHNVATPPLAVEVDGQPVDARHDASRRLLTVPVRQGREPFTVDIQLTPAPGTSAGKPVIYQAFTRLFGNTVTRNTPWGTIEENGVGKFSDINDDALRGLRELGATHVWYTGVPHHAVIRDYTAWGLDSDDPDVVKGRAGSPYAVRDYYNVNPDLADDPEHRLAEFDALIERTHAHGLAVMIDIVPNHVARAYRSTNLPPGERDFGADDDTSVTYARDNNFYYVVGEPFRVPVPADGYRPLGGDPHPLADGRFDEFPARWTGNGARSAQPAHDDWYETVRINYGVRPDGSFDFTDLPAELAGAPCAAHLAFWADRDVPDSWRKFRAITAFWIERGVDGFRFDMAELVPVAFWSYLNCHIKSLNPDAVLLAEVYDPGRYRDYLARGKMDYLYDKVGFYDTLRPVMAGTAGTDALVDVHASVADIAPHMLHFLENHDEQRIASDAFAGDARTGIPGMAVSALISPAPVLVYFGQEVGERGDGNPGFGAATRTTIFDYWGVPAHQAWMNGGRFDGGALDAAQRALREDYQRILSLAAGDPIVSGHYRDLHAHNRSAAEGYDDRLFAFARWNRESALVVTASFDRARGRSFTLGVPAELIAEWGLADGRYALADALSDSTADLEVRDGRGSIELTLAPLAASAWRFGLPAAD